MTISAPVESVWPFIAEPRKRPEWLVELEEVDAPDPPLRAGDRFTAVSHVFRHRVEGASHVTEAETNRLIGEEIHLGVRIDSRWTLRSVDGRTEVVHELELHEPRGPLGPVVAWLLKRYLRRLQKRSLKQLARRVVAS